MARARCVIALLVGASACVPYAVPPTNVAVGASRSTGVDARTSVHADFGYAPFQLSKDELERLWDATVSVSLDHTPSRDAWGAALAAGPVFHPWGPDVDMADRLLPQLVGRWTADNHAAAVRIIVERSRFADGKTGDGMGVMYGELAYGAFLEAGRQWSTTGREAWAITLGLTLRGPAAAGVACCLLPK
jgi:hypothetical protein